MTKDEKRTCGRCGAPRPRGRGVYSYCGDCRLELRAVRPTLLVGMNPGKGTAHDGPAFVGSQSGERLAKLCGLQSSSDLTTRLTLVNLFVDAWQHRAAARESAEAIRRDVVHGHFVRVVLVGRAVAKAFGHDLDWFAWDERKQLVDGTWWCWDRAVIPHTSGLNHVWNDQRVRDLGREFMTKLWEEA